MRQQHPEVDPDRLVPVVGALADASALQKAADLSQAAIHLVGIIIQRRLQGQTFKGIHVRGTHRMVKALQSAGVKRYIHMSALGARADAVAPYHQSKWQAEFFIASTTSAHSPLIRISSEAEIKRELEGIRIFAAAWRVFDDLTYPFGQSAEIGRFYMTRCQ